MRLIVMGLFFMVSVVCSKSCETTPSSPAPPAPPGPPGPPGPPAPPAPPAPSPMSLDFCEPGERPMLVINNSSKSNVWLGLTSGSISAQPGDDCKNFGGQFTGTHSIPGPSGQTITGVCSCSTTSSTTGKTTVTSCGSLASCAVTTTIHDYLQSYAPPPGSTLHYCFWNPPRLIDTTTTSMPTQGSVVKLCFPKPQSSNFQWSGNLFARYGCDASGQHCASADCASNIQQSKDHPNNPYCPHLTCGPSYLVPEGHSYENDCPNDGTCAPQNGFCILGQGGQPPATLAEFTLTQKDFYDISIINGINMGISMAPDLTHALVDSSNPYTCGTPGAQEQSSKQDYLQGCPWNINLAVPGFGDQSFLLRQVVPIINNSNTKPTYQSCPCTAPHVCGLALNTLNTTQGKFVQVCGTDVQAYWTADQICGSLSGNLGQPIHNLYPLPCINTKTIPAARQQYMIDLFGCVNGQQSCYNSSESPCTTGQGCGCPENNHYGQYWPKAAPDSTLCRGTNSDWVTFIQPWLVPLKQACPTAYTFPYDDVTSTFTCQAGPSVTTPGSGPGYIITLFDITTHVGPY